MMIRSKGKRRKGEKWFANEAKSFEIKVKGSGSKLKGYVIERSKALVSWIRFGELGLKSLLKGVTECCREQVPEGCFSEWKEKDRIFRLECRSNRVGRYLICSVRDGEGKRHKIFIPEGKGLVRGWEVLAEKLQELGTIERQPEKRIKEGGQTLKGMVEKKSSFVEVVKGCIVRSENKIWVEAVENETKKEVGTLKKCLVGSWASVPNPFPSEKE